MEIVCDLLQERGLLADLVKITKSQLININVQALCNLVHDTLGDVHPLWSTKAAIRGVADGISLAEPSADPSMRDVIAIIDMGTSAVPG